MEYGSEIITEYNEKYKIQNKWDLMYCIQQMPEGTSIDFSEIENIETGELGTAYAVEKMRWTDSLVVLIGGYGGDTLCASLWGTSDEDNYEIERKVDDFFYLRCMDDYELIAIACNKNI